MSEDDETTPERAGDDAANRPDATVPDDDGAASDDADAESAAVPSDPSERWATGPYVESQVIMTTVQLVSPFALTYGLFVTFHGADSHGGGFQGGAIIGATILMIAFAFGIESARRWLKNRIVVGLAAGGVAVFALVGLGSVAFGRAFLDYSAYDAFPIPHPVKYGIEAVEIGGIALIVSGVVIGLFFATAGGYSGRADTGRMPDGGRVRDGDRTAGGDRSSDGGESR